MIKEVVPRPLSGTLNSPPLGPHRTRSPKRLLWRSTPPLSSVTPPVPSCQTLSIPLWRGIDVEDFQVSLPRLSPNTMALSPFVAFSLPRSQPPPLPPIFLLVFLALSRVKGLLRRPPPGSLVYSSTFMEDAPDEVALFLIIRLWLLSPPSV